MYLFYNSELRFIISVFDSDLTEEDKEGYKPEGATGLEVQESDFPEGWPCELSDYYIDDEGNIVEANTYTDFNTPISLIVGETYSWVALEDCSIISIDSEIEGELSKGETLTFTGTDPGLYIYNIRSKTYKEAFIEIGVSMP